MWGLVMTSRVSAFSCVSFRKPHRRRHAEVLSHAKPYFSSQFPSERSLAVRCVGGDADCIASGAASRWQRSTFGALVGVQAAETNQVWTCYVRRGPVMTTSMFQILLNLRGFLQIASSTGLKLEFRVWRFSIYQVQGDRVHDRERDFRRS